MRAWMEALVAAKGSDLHLKAGSPPRMRVDGRLVVLDGPALTPETAERLLKELIRPDLHEQFQRTNSKWRCEARAWSPDRPLMRA